MKMKKIIFYLLTIFLVTSEFTFGQDSSKTETPDLIPYRCDDKWGFCDKDKNIIIDIN